MDYLGHCRLRTGIGMKSDDDVRVRGEQLVEGGAAQSVWMFA